MRIKIYFNINEKNSNIITELIKTKYDVGTICFMPVLNFTMLTINYAQTNDIHLNYSDMLVG